MTETLLGDSGVSPGWPRAGAGGAQAALRLGPADGGTACPAPEELSLPRAPHAPGLGPAPKPFTGWGHSLPVLGPLHLGCGDP